jgi:hypothetical protein
MLPHEIKMVEKLKDRPFALLGLNSDGDRSVVNKILKEQGIKWRQGILGTTSAALAKKWNITSWPTVFILDEKGIIRYRDLRGDDLEKAVEKLLDKMKPKEKNVSK